MSGMSSFLTAAIGVNRYLNSSDQRELWVDTWCEFPRLSCSWNLPWGPQLEGRYINMVQLLRSYFS